VFDCDKSRTPRILFDHAGITDARSQTEWQKHLAIQEAPQWETGDDNQSLVYTCQKCPSPVVEKAIHQIVGWVNDEIAKVRAASLSTPHHESRPTLNLPSQARVEIKARAGSYLYHDMEFRLDRDAVVELLMGESLYGGPELALRELVQNALDAVHLRDQRSKLAKALNAAGGTEKPRQPHQAWDGQQAEVTVTWGEENGRRFVRVQDSGVGMTVGTMRRFLTQIGKSYYKSDDFRAEQELMRRNGILCTAISQFGIGFLSVFMLADEVTIYTRPVGVSPEQEQPPADLDLQETARFPFRAEIHGPHGLLAFYPDRTATLPGTTVTLWLKDNFVLPDWDRDVLIARLRQEFYKLDLSKEVDATLNLQRESLSASQQLLDPGFEIGRFIVWPLYPVKLAADATGSPLVLNDTFHHRELLPLDPDALKAKALEWGHNIQEIDQTDWRVCDWRDEHSTTSGIEGTGSRIRLVGPQPGTTPEISTPQAWTALSEYLPSGQPRLLLGSFTEPQLPKPLTRYQCLVNGVRIVPGYVPSDSKRDCQLPAVIKQLPILPGAGGWVWIDLRGAAMPRLRADRSAPIATQPEPPDWNGLLQRWNAARPDFAPVWLMSQTLCSQHLHAEPSSGVRRIGLGEVAPEMIGALSQAEASVVYGIYTELPHDLRGVVSNARVGALALALALALDRDRTESGWRGVLLASGILSHLASEAFGSPLSECLPATGLAGLPGSLTDLSLTGPLHVHAAAEAVAPPKWLAAYDVAFPCTVFLLSSLRQTFPDWTVQKLRRLYMLPLLYGQEPSQYWRQRLSEDRPFDSLLLFLPNPDHWEWLFADHPLEEWEQGSASALWDLKTGKVLYADGIHTRASICIKGVGKTLDNWLKQEDPLEQ
jgi:hypothetical protein